MTIYFIYFFGRPKKNKINKINSHLFELFYFQGPVTKDLDRK